MNDEQMSIVEGAVQLAEAVSDACRKLAREAGVPEWVLFPRLIHDRDAWAPPDPNPFPKMHLFSRGRRER